METHNALPVLIAGVDCRLAMPEFRDWLFELAYGRYHRFCPAGFNRAAGLHSSIEANVHGWCTR
ncbi:hypothetical protein AB833_04965 [Chromatiales bacterium (ex Bugula neritina AB1)]|nr:hypothetical protein AB833_04965 [Chromatiales bacterium (ex Bugula neritina AB1)]